MRRYRWLALIMAAVLVLGLVLTGCGQKQQAAPGGGAGQPAQPSAQGQAQPASGKVIELKFNDWGPPGIGIGKLHQQAAKMIEEKTNGQVKVTCYFSESLAKYPETFKAVTTGITDITLFTVASMAGTLHANRVLSLVMTGLPDFEKIYLVYQEMLKNHPELQQEMEKFGAHWLHLRPMPPNQIHMVKSAVRLPQDVRGKKIIASGDLGDLINSMHGGAVNVGPGDWYTSLEKGVAEGQFTHWAAVADFKLDEVMKYHAHVGPGGLGTTAIGFLVNLDTWKSLPPDVQQVLLDVYQWVDDESVKYDANLIKEAVEKAKQQGHQVVELSPQEIEAWSKAVQPYIDKWISETEAKGWPAKKLYDGLQELIKKYQ
ncbi:MAG: TRAP transporter substrate-binding protein [Moorellales bacterium]